MFYPFEVFLVVEQTVGSTMSGIFKGLDVRINLVAVRYQFMKLRLILRVVAGCSSVRAHDRTGERPFSTHSVVNAGRVSYRRVRVEERFLVEQFALSPCRAFRHVRRQQVRRTVFGQRLLALRALTERVHDTSHRSTACRCLGAGNCILVPSLAGIQRLLGTPTLHRGLRAFSERTFRKRPLTNRLEEAFLGDAFSGFGKTGLQPLLGDVLDDLAFGTDSEVQRSSRGSGSECAPRFVDPFFGLILTNASVFLRKVGEVCATKSAGPLPGSGTHRASKRTKCAANDPTRQTSTNVGR